MRPSPTRRSSRSLLLAAALVTLPCSAARAQWVTGLGTDALVLPRGMVRVSVGGAFDGFDELFSADATGAPTGGRRPLGAALSVAALDATTLPQLAPLQTELRSLTGLSTLGLSLGSLTVDAEARRAELPVRLEFGLGARMQLFVAAPYVQTHVAVRATGDPTATLGNIGVNPAVAGTSGAYTTNAALVTGLRTAASQLETQLAGCASGGTAAACSRPEDAAELRDALRSFASGLEQVYGTSDEQPGSAFVPVAGSAAATALAGRVTDLAAEAQEFGVAAVGASAAPAHAPSPLTPGEVQELAASGASELGLPALRDSWRYGIGDTEVGLTLRLLDPSRGELRAAEAGLTLRASVTALVRFGTGRTDDPLDPLDLAVGDGQTDVEVGVAADVLSGRRFATSLAARYGVQLEDELDRLVPPAGGRTYLTAEYLRRVRRDLGDYVEAEITPRYALNEYLAIGAHYRFRAKGADAYELGPADPLADPNPDLTLDPSLLEFGTESRQHVVGLGVVVSTLGAYGRGGARWPMDVTYRHSRAVSGGGLGTPAQSRDEVTLRVYVDVFGGRRARR